MRRFCKDRGAENQWWLTKTSEKRSLKVGVLRVLCRDRADPKDANDGSFRPEDGGHRGQTGPKPQNPIGTMTPERTDYFSELAEVCRLAINSKN